jgi:hypothetical protein
MPTGDQHSPAMKKVSYNQKGTEKVSCSKTLAPYMISTYSPHFAGTKTTHIRLQQVQEVTSCSEIIDFH